MTASELLALMTLLDEMIARGVTTIARIRDLLKQEGATPEQLAALDARLSAAIARREAEQRS